MREMEKKEIVRWGKRGTYPEEVYAWPSRKVKTQAFGKGDV